MATSGDFHMTIDKRCPVVAWAAANLTNVVVRRIDLPLAIRDAGSLGVLDRLVHPLSDVRDRVEALVVGFGNKSP